MCFMTYMFFLWNHWEVWVYILGAIVAQLDLLATERADKNSGLLGAPANQTLPPSPPRSPAPQPQANGRGEAASTSEPPQDHLHSLLRVFGFLVAFYFLSYPIDGSRDYAPGYMTLNLFIPDWMERKDKFWPNIGTAILLFLLARAHPTRSAWRRILDGEVAQYLGKISFALYLVHGPILHAFGYMVPQRIWWTFGVEGVELGNVSWAVVVFIGWAVGLASSLWAADVWTREVESRCVKAVKRFEEWCFVKK
jgi:hypothetical protein